MSSRRALALPLVLAALTSGCGTPASNGDAAKGVPQILTAVASAVATAHSVRVVGSVKSDGGTVTLDLTLVSGRGGTGTIGIDGTRARIARVGNTAYIDGTAAFWRRYGAGALAGRLAGRWISGPATSDEFGSLRSFTSIAGLYAEFTSSASGWRKQRMTTVRGTRAFTLIDSAGEVLTIAAVGAPYPLALRGGAGATGAVTFTGWGSSFAIAAPRGATPYTRLTG
jgi:hypothetical protein